MTNNTKQSEDTYIQWSVNMNDAIQVGQLATEPILTIHPDGRVTTSDKLKPDEIASAVLQMMKEQWLMDPQAKLIREQNDRIKRMEEALEECDRAFTKHCPEHESRYGDAWEKVRDALNRPNPFKPYWPEENQ